MFPSFLAIFKYCTQLLLDKLVKNQACYLAYVKILGMILHRKGYFKISPEGMEQWSFTGVLTVL